jgi:hypothetical protein
VQLYNIHDQILRHNRHSLTRVMIEPLEQLATLADAHTQARDLWRYNVAIGGGVVHAQGRVGALRGDQPSHRR